MAHTAYLPIIADRYGAVVRHIFVVGLDLTGLDMRAQVRLYGDVPGAPLIDLLTVGNGNAQGLRLVEVTSDDIGIPTSHVELVINETTMEGLPYAGEIGDVTTLAWDWQVTIAGRKRRLAKGEFQITGDGVTGAGIAPANRSAPFGNSQRPVIDVWSSARLTFGEEQVTVQIDGADLVAPLAKKASDAADRATADAATANLAAGAAQATARYFTTRAAGEAASTVNQSFATDDGAGNVIYYRRTSGGSAEIGRAVTPASLAAADGAARVGFGGRTVQARLSDDVNVRDFGPGLDNSSDWTTAIRQAIASVDIVGGRGGTVYFPVGVYRITDTIDLPERVKLQGAGCRSTIVNSEHPMTAIRLADTDFGGVSGMRIAVATDSATAVALELYSDNLWVQWNNFDDLEITAAYAYTRGQKGIWCHSRDVSTTITYNHWTNIRIGGFHKPWVIDDYYEGNFHYHIHANGYGIDADDPAILHYGAANHWECWFGKASSPAPTLVGIAYAGIRTNNRFKVTADIGPGKAMKVIGAMPTGGKANSYEVTGTEAVTPVGDVANAATLTRGTFAPTVSGAETAGAGTYNTAAGVYSRIGDRVFFDISIDWSAHSGVGNVHVGGLPLPAVEGEPLSIVTVVTSGLQYAGSAVLIIQAGSAAGILYAQKDGALTPINVANSGGLRISGSYRIVI